MPLNCAVIGCGFIGNLHARAVAASPHAILTTCYDTDHQRAQSVAAAFGGSAAPTLSQALENVQAAFIATPDHLHVEPTLAALAAGCDVFCEKPLAMSLADCRTMTAAADAAGRRLAVDYNRRFGFGYRKAFQLLEEGRIGPVQHGLLRVTDNVPGFVRGRGEYALLTSLLTHHIDLLRWLCGEIESVHARFSHPNAEENQYRDMVLSFGHRGGAVTTLLGGWRQGSSRTIEWAEIGGTQGVVQVDDVQRSCTLHGLQADTMEIWRPNYFWGENTAFYDSLHAHVLAFLEAVAVGGRTPISAAEGVRGLEVCEAAVQSHLSGNSVDVSELSGEKVSRHSA
jgi:myo-inositol 2-dehydrogenase/D-chiro-inositol 1-dehydrogenase